VKPINSGNEGMANDKEKLDSLTSEASIDFSSDNVEKRLKPWLHKHLSIIEVTAMKKIRKLCHQRQLLIAKVTMLKKRLESPVQRQQLIVLVTAMKKRLEP
jgi:hypothetical protein